MKAESQAKFDPSEIERWALAYLTRLSDSGRRGVLLGGSIARGQQWAHSDLEAGLLVEARQPELPYFNVDTGRGVEVIQLVSSELTEQVRQVEAGDLDAVAKWPIQLYRARIISDATGLLARFTALFDRRLFSPPVVQLKIRQHFTSSSSYLVRARDLLATNCPRAAVTEVRGAMNEVILALYWSLGELPRSQSRTDSRLRDLTIRHKRPGFYQLYRAVFDLDTTEVAVAGAWPKVRAQVLELTKLWGARDFFEHSVDSNFTWGENGGILSVYRLYIPIMGRPDVGIFNQLDRVEWASANSDLLMFLGLSDANPATVEAWAKQVEDALTEIIKPVTALPAGKQA